MSERPWFALARGIFEHPRFAGAELCDLSCFAWLVSRARYQDDEGIRRGQLIVTVPELVEAWGWTNRGKRPAEAVRRLLRRWSEGDDPAITTEPVSNGGRTVGTLVTILRYDNWQRPANESLLGCRATHNATHKQTHQETHNATPLDTDDSGQFNKAADASPDAPRDASPDAPRDTLLFNRHERHVGHEQQRAHAREDAAAADPRLSWEAVRDLWVETWRGYYDGTPKMKLGGPHLGPVAFVAERLIELADEVGVDDAVAHVAAVFETYLEDKGHWFLTNQHPLAWLTKADEGATEPRWHQWAMRDPWYAARQSSSHHVAQSEASLTSATPKPPAQSHDHHVADLSLPTYSRATGEDADEVREVLQQLVNDGLDAIKTGVLCRAGDDLALVFSDDMDMLLSAKRLARYLPDVACMHGAVEREQRGGGVKRRLTGRLKLVHRDERDQPYVLCMTTAGREVRHDLPYEPSGRRARCPLCAERARERDRLWLIDRQRGQTAREGA